MFEGKRGISYSHGSDVRFFSIQGILGAFGFGGNCVSAGDEGQHSGHKLAPSPEPKRRCNCSSCNDIMKKIQ